VAVSKEIMNGKQMLQKRLHLNDLFAGSMQSAHQLTHLATKRRVFNINPHQVILNRKIPCQHPVKPALGRLFQENGSMTLHQLGSHADDFRSVN
jgi:hypothetical protein